MTKKFLFRLLAGLSLLASIWAVVARNRPLTHPSVLETATMAFLLLIILGMKGWREKLFPLLLLLDMGLSTLLVMAFNIRNAGIMPFIMSGLYFVTAAFYVKESRTP